MFKIGEFSKLSQVSIRMLRYYDENDILKPAYIDPESGYRMYSIDQLNKLQKIVLLRDLSFSISEIREAIQNWDDRYLLTLLADKKEEIQKTIEQEQLRVKRIESAVLDLQQSQLEMHYHIQFKSVPSYSVLSLRKIVVDYFEEEKLWAELSEYVQSNHIEVVHGKYNNLSIYHNSDIIMNGVDIEIGVVVPLMGEDYAPFTYRNTEALDQVAYMMVKGPYSHLAKAYEAVAVWLNEHEEYEIYGDSRQVSHVGPGECVSENDYLTEVQIPVRRRQ